MSRRPIRSAELCLAALVIAAGEAYAAKNDIVQLVSPGWRAGTMERLPLETVRRWGGDPAVEREYGVGFLEHQVFTEAQGTADVVAEHAADASSAYGLFTFYRAADMTPVPDMRYAVSGKAGALFFRGQLFIRVVLPASAATPIAPANLRALLVALGAALPPTEDMSALPAPLPVAGLLPGSEKYLIGPEAARRVVPFLPADLLGFNLGAEVETGVYSQGTSQATVAVVTYPTPQIARSRYEQMQKRLPLNQAGPEFGKQEGSFVILVSNAPSPAAAARLIELFNRRVAVSWDKPYLGDQPPLLQMLNFIVQNLFFVFYLCGWSVVGGIVIYLSRQAARKWLPQTSFGQPDDARFITLKLN
jgi:uncharacterized protein DUF6599